MQQPARFTEAVLGCTAVMTTLYGGFGAFGCGLRGGANRSEQRHVAHRSKHARRERLAAS